MAKAETIKVRVMNQDGERDNREVKVGSKLQDVVDVNGYSVLLEGDVVTEGSNPELRDKDVIELVRKSGKAG